MKKKLLALLTVFGITFASVTPSNAWYGRYYGGYYGGYGYGGALVFTIYDVWRN